MDYEPHKARLLAHYITLSKLPGWKAYAWDRVKQLARDCPELYADFPARVTEANQPTERTTHDPKRLL